MKKSLFKGKSTRTKIFTAITVVAIVLLLCLNLLFTHLGSERMLFVDLTPEGLYTPTEAMRTACAEILDSTDGEGNKRQIKITFCGDPDYLIANRDLRVIYYMCLAMRNSHSNVTVETVNVELNPTAVAMYKTTSRQQIEPTDVIVSYGQKYRVLSANSFWTANSDGSYFSFNGEYEMVSTLASLTAINHPKAYFVIGHGETYYDPAAPDSETSKKAAALADLIVSRGLEIKTLNLSEVKKVPDDCALLIINNPTEDFAWDPDRLDELSYVSDTEKLSRYLISDAGSVIVTKAYDVELPNFESFLYEWGFEFGNALVKDEENSLTDVGEEGTAVVGVYDTDDQSFGYAYYDDYALLSSSPRMVFTNTGYITCSFYDGTKMSEPGTYNTTKNYAPFIGSSDGAVAYKGPGSTEIVSEAGYKCLAAASVRTALDSVTAETTYSYIFCANSADFLSNDTLSNAAYANADVMANVISNLSRTDRFADMTLGGFSMNSPSYGGKQLISTTMSDSPQQVYAPDASLIGINSGLGQGAVIGYTVLVMLPPLIAAGVGLFVFIRRKFK